MELELLNQTDTLSFIKLDWSKSFYLNGPVIEYTLLIDKKKVYSGKQTSFIVDVKNDQCVSSEYAKENGEKMRGFLDVIRLQLQVLTIYSKEKSPEILVPINCTSKCILNYKIIVNR